MNTIKKGDLNHIGRARYNDNGNTTFVCLLNKAREECILLRKILAHL